MLLILAKGWEACLLEERRRYMLDTEFPISRYVWCGVQSLDAKQILYGIYWTLKMNRLYSVASIGKSLADKLFSNDASELGWCARNYIYTEAEQWSLQNKLHCGFLCIHMMKQISSIYCLKKPLFATNNFNKPSVDSHCLNLTFWYL